MNPHQKNKIDVSSLTPEEQRLFRLYGKLPSKSDHFAKHLKERKYFDSGDYAMSQAGKGDKLDTGSVGSQHPVPENIPHLSSQNGGPGHQHHGSISSVSGHQTGGAAVVGMASSPVKESGLFKTELSNSDENDAVVVVGADKDLHRHELSSSVNAKDIPIRR